MVAYNSQFSWKYSQQACNELRTRYGVYIYIYIYIYSQYIVSVPSILDVTAAELYAISYYWRYGQVAALLRKSPIAIFRCFVKWYFLLTDSEWMTPDTPSLHSPPRMTSSNGNIFRVTGHLCGEFTGPQWIPRTKASEAELWCFLWSAPE